MTERRDDADALQLARRRVTALERALRQISDAVEEESDPLEHIAQVVSDMLTPGYSPDPPGDGMVTALAALRQRLRIGAWSALNAGRPAELLAQIGAEIDAILAAGR